MPNNAALDTKKQALIALYRRLFAQQGLDPDVANRLANERAQREVFGGAYPKSPAETLNDLQSESNLMNEGRYSELLNLNSAGKGEQTGFLDSQNASMMGLAGAGVDAGIK